MPLVAESSGTQTAVVGTEHTLATPTTNKTRVLRVDCGNMIAGDTVEIRIKTAVLAAGTVREQQNVTYANALGSAIIESIPISSNQGATFTLKQTTGTARQFPWCVLTID
jgi:hypothetical protein